MNVLSWRFAPTERSKRQHTTAINNKSDSPTTTYYAHMAAVGTCWEGLHSRTDVQMCVAPKHTLLDYYLVVCTGKRRSGERSAGVYFDCSSATTSVVLGDILQLAAAAAAA